MKVAIIYDLGSPITTGVYFHRSFQELGFQVDAYDHNSVNNIPDEYQIYFVVDSGPQYEIPRWKSGISFYYSIDTHLDFENRFTMAKSANVSIMAQNSCGAQRAVDRGLPTLWMPLGCDPWIHKDYQVERDLDIAFVGHIYEDDDWRRTIKAKLLAKGYEENKIFVGETTKEDMGMIYSRAKVVLNHTVRDNKQDVNMRVFEAMSSGAYLLTQKLDHDDMDKIFPKELYGDYTNDESMFSQLDFVLKKWNTFAVIGQKAKMFVRRNHTYTEHLKRIIDGLIGVKDEQQN